MHTKTRTHWLVTTGTLALLYSCFVGCSLLRQAEDREIVPQFDRAKSFNGTANHNERELCIETAKSLATKGHATEAIALYEKAGSLESNGQSFDLELAPLFAQIGDSETAVARYESAIASGHADSSTFNNLAWTLMDMGRADAALEAVGRGLMVTPDDQRLRSTQAVVLHRKGDRQGALSNFESMYGLSAAHHNMAILEMEAGRTDAAVEHAKLSTQYPDCSRESVALRDALMSKVAMTTNKSAASK